jgi:ABC-type nitrate/sulfonate/bicarbonate transport system substrate-binding protein
MSPMSETFTRTKLFSLVVALGLLASACGAGTTTSASPTPAPTTAATAAATPAPGTLPAPELTKVRIGLSAPTEPVQFAEKLADQLGYYKELGITTVEITGFEGDGKALQALVAGQLDMYVGGSSTAINSVITDTPVKIVSMNSVINTDGMFCQKDIKTANDVKGKRVAISTFGGTSHGSALLALKGLGLTTKDATITEVGNEGTRIAALKGGSVSCGVVSMEQQATLASFGLNLLIDITKTGQWGRSGLMARVDFLAKNPNTMLNIVAAVVRAQNTMFTDPKTASAKFAEYTQAKPADADLAISLFPNYGLRSMIFTAEAFQAPRDVLAAVNPAVANVDVTKAFDLSFLQKLQDNGFYAKYSIPTK